MPLPTLSELRMIHAWSPLLGYGRRLRETLDARERAEILAEATEWFASMTKSKLDDRVAKKLAAVFKTQAGVELVDTAVTVVDEILDAMPQEPAQ
jgi:hypothetical protein